MIGSQLPSNDQERLIALSTIYVKGLSTPKDELAFSADMLIYLKPFILKLQSAAADSEGGNINLELVRQVIDQLLADIYEEVRSVCLRLGGKRGERVAADYGLAVDVNSYVADYYYKQSVA
jgi:hypothetical protein